MPRSSSSWASLGCMLLAVLFCGCVARSDAMQKLAAPLPSLPWPGHAVVVFIRPSKHAYAEKVPIVDRWGRLLGISTASSWFEAQLPPGPHVFFTAGGDVSALRATLEPDKTYFVHVATGWGLGSNVQLLAIAPRFERWQDRELWLAHSVGYQLTAPDQEPIHSDAERRREVLAQGFELLEADYDPEQLDHRTLMPHDGI